MTRRISKFRMPFPSRFANAVRGIWWAIKSEPNFKIHFVITAAVIAAAIFLHVSQLEWLLLTLCIGGVISLELMNTAIEAAVDLISPDYHDLARLAKDASAGAVLAGSLTAAIVGIVIFWK